MDFLHTGVDQSLVTLFNDNPEGSLVDGAGNTGHRVCSLRAGGALVDPLGADLQLGLAEVVDHPLAVNTGQLSHLHCVAVILHLSLLLLSNRDKVLGHVAHVHHAGGVLEHLVLLIMRETENVKGLVSELDIL